MKDLATESANGTSSTEDKAAMRAEFDALAPALQGMSRQRAEAMLGSATPC